MAAKFIKSEVEVEESRSNPASPDEDPDETPTKSDIEFINHAEEEEGETTPQKSTKMKEMEKKLAEKAAKNKSKKKEVENPKKEKLKAM